MPDHGNTQPVRPVLSETTREALAAHRAGRTFVDAELPPEWTAPPKPPTPPMRVIYEWDLTDLDQHDDPSWELRRRLGHVPAGAFLRVNLGQVDIIPMIDLAAWVASSLAAMELAEVEIRGCGNGYVYIAQQIQRHLAAGTFR